MELYHPTTRQDFGAKNRMLIFGGSLATVPSAAHLRHHSGGTTLHCPN